MKHSCYPFAQSHTPACRKGYDCIARLMPMCLPVLLYRTAGTYKWLFQRNRMQKRNLPLASSGEADAPRQCNLRGVFIKEGRFGSGDIRFLYPAEQFGGFGGERQRHHPFFAKRTSAASLSSKLRSANKCRAISVNSSDVKSSK